MIKQLPEKKIPEWLANPDLSNFSISQLLEESCYYPACGLDGTPIENPAGNILSFIYADYLRSRDEVLNDLHTPDYSSGLSWLGYECVFAQELSYSRILPRNWLPTIFPTAAEGREQLMTRGKEILQGDPTDFIYWTVWENKTENRRLSLLYIKEEMSACYQGLYYATGIPPKVLTIIQPYGMAWENIMFENSFFKRVVMNHPGGMPEYLIYGGQGRDEQSFAVPCWQEYIGGNPIRLKGKYARLWRINNQC